MGQQEKRGSKLERLLPTGAAGLLFKLIFGNRIGRVERAGRVGAEFPVQAILQHVLSQRPAFAPREVAEHILKLSSALAGKL